MLRGRAAGELGTQLRAMVPVAFPGAPWEALLGFTVIGLQREDTGAGERGRPGRNNVFHEVGYFQTPAGPSDGPAPPANPRAEWNSWGALAGSPLVVRLLGHEATTVPGAWAGAVPDQCAVGLADLASNQRAFNRSAPALAVTIPSGQDASGSLWGIWLAFSSFSAGPGAVAGELAHYSTRLRGLTEDARPMALLGALAADVRSGMGFVPPRQHPNPCYTAMRTWQKLASARALVAANGGDVGTSSWWGPLPTDLEMQRAIVAGAEGVS
jgi:hypothetical protein